ncbi:MAG: ATP-binding protein [Flavobacteriales bacterium]|nr:ATP-binding protein [Flavobacteriales bacterium]
MIFKRDIYTELTLWKNRDDRKPLILRGARQVGKTTVVNHFSKNYKQYIYLNLEKEKDIQIFNNNDDVKTIIESLFLKFNLTDNYNETLLFIDEIQESSKAIHFLRYFYEEYPNLSIISAGSLLEFAFENVNSLPVGRVEFLYLSPLSFPEFLNAINHKNATTALNTIPLKTTASNTLLELFNTYAIVGGMPEIIKEYIKSNSFINLNRIYESLWETYKLDIEKYGKSKTSKKIIKHVINTAPFEVDKRIKFQNFGNSNYKSREIGEALRNLNDAKIIQLIYPTTNLEPPIQENLKKSPRLQFLDTGILNHILGIQNEMIQLKDLNNSYRGAIIPHLIAQELIALHCTKLYKPNFWVREKNQTSSEVDLVVKFENIIVPIEIKSGSTGSLKSLHQFIERSTHHYAVRMYAGELKIEQLKTPNGKEYILLNLPYFLASQLPKYLNWFIKKNKLCTEDCKIDMSS